MKIGIFGGSFNPIHVGHIGLARQMLQLADLDEVWLMVSPQNPLKCNDQLLDDDQRLSLARQALEGVEGIRVSDYEFHLPRPSYTWNTLQHLCEDFPEHRFSLIIGADNWVHFDRWRNAKEIVENFQILVYPREGLQIDEFALPPTVRLVHTQLFNVSSTEIRQRLHDLTSIEGLVPACVADEVQRLYSK